MKVYARPRHAQLQKCDALKSKTDDKTLFGVLVAFVPDAAFCLKKVRAFFREAVEARAAYARFAFNQKAQADGELAVSFLIGFDGGEPRHQIAFAVGCAARVEFAIID